MKRALVAATLAALALSTAACGSGSSTSSSAAKTTETVVTTVESAADTVTDTAETTGETERATETTPGSTAAATSQPAAADAVPAWIEDPAQVGGECGTTPEGARASAAPATSCGFAGVLYAAAKQKTYTWLVGPSGNPLYRTEAFTVVSPTTQQEYTVSCFIGSDLSSISCEDPADRTRGAGFSLHDAKWPEFVATTGR